jgi:hypothetical protein
VIGGCTQPGGERKYMGALLVGVNESEKLKFAGRVGTGFGEKLLKALSDELNKIAVKACPFYNLPATGRGLDAGLTAAEMKRCRWVKPTMLCEIKFTEWTRDDRLQQTGVSWNKGRQKRDRCGSGKGKLEPPEVHGRSRSASGSRLCLADPSFWTAAIPPSRRYNPSARDLSMERSVANRRHVNSRLKFLESHLARQRITPGCETTTIPRIFSFG